LRLVAKAPLPRGRTVCPLSPGTGKWNEFEDRLFSFITQSWSCQPLVSYRIITAPIAGTTTDTGLQVRCALDPNADPAASKSPVPRWMSSTLIATASKTTGVTSSNPSRLFVAIAHEQILRLALFLPWRKEARHDPEGNERSGEQ
jgi:hypothetical protein